MFGPDASLNGCGVVIRPEDMVSNTRNPVKSLAPNWMNIWCMIMINGTGRQNIGIVYYIRGKFLCLCPSHFVPWFGCAALSVKRELTILSDDSAHRRRPSSRFHTVNYNPSDHKLAQKWLTSGLMVECQGEAGGCGYQKNCAPMVTNIKM